jgi:hypothetical protein
MVRALLSGNKTQTRRLAKPRASAGDRIWCRETWAPVDFMTGSELDDPLEVGYRADLTARYVLGGGKIDTYAWNWDCIKWRPSLLMPKWAARIWLQVTDVRTEPLLNVTDADAFAEGVTPRGSGAIARAYQFQIAGKTFEAGTPRACFLAAWDGFNVKCPSSTNPTVTVYTFERLP